MQTTSRYLTALLLAALFTAAWPNTALAQISADRRQSEVRHLDLDYTTQLRSYQSKEEWLARAAVLRKQILVSAGLWPTPVKQPLNPTVFGRVDRGDHTIEKVYFESYPGHYVSGNLYRPKNLTGKAPAVLCPHGHWSYGRLENTPLNSGPGRALSFARQGYIAFTWDMAGYNDSAAISHRFAIGHREGTSHEVLWGVNLLGLQLWNAIRALDFLLSLPEVDPERVACTGESGGGTQTFLLTGVDERIKVAAPVNMVSTTMQGGSLCENAPNLRIDTNNVELASLIAPRPLLLVSATGDWTKNTLQVEYPAIRNIYRLFGAEDKLHAVQMNAPHNYNQESREAVYGWFAHWLQGRAERTPLKERGLSIAALPELLVFFSRPRPANELNEEQLSESLIAAAQKQLATAQPRDNTALAGFREQFGEAFKYALLAEYPQPAEVSAVATSAQAGWESLALSRRGRLDQVEARFRRPAQPRPQSAYVLVVGDAAGEQSPLSEQLAAAGHHVLQIGLFRRAAAVPAQLKFFTTYNRTDAANSVQDVLTALAYLNGKRGQSPLFVVATGRSGPHALLARGLAPRIERVLIDADQFANASDKAFLQSLPIPGIRRAGDFATAVTLAPLTPLLIHNTGAQFQAAPLAEIYARLGSAANFAARAQRLSAAELLAWLNAK